MKTAQSSHIQGHAYDDDSRVLTIQFTNGAMYRYGGVDPNTYYAFAQSGSPGSYFHAKIKGNFSGELIAKGDTRSRKR